MRRYLATLDLNNPPDHAKLVAVYSDVMQEIGERAKHGDAYYDLAPVKAKWSNTLTAAGFEVDQWSFVVTDPARPASAPSFTPDALAALSDPSAILDHLNRLGDTVDSDPRLAVSTAKALIESTAKCVLSAREVPYTRSDKCARVGYPRAGVARTGSEGSERRGPLPTPGPAVARDPGPKRHGDTQSGRRRSRSRERATLGPSPPRSARRRCGAGLVSAHARNAWRPRSSLAAYDHGDIKPGVVERGPKAPVSARPLFLRRIRNPRHSHAA
jgi:hypothetical protein